LKSASLPAHARFTRSARSVRAPPTTNTLRTSSVLRVGRANHRRLDTYHRRHGDLQARHVLCATNMLRAIDERDVSSACGHDEVAPFGTSRFAVVAFSSRFGRPRYPRRREPGGCP
jgi:hypothetical protein